MEQGKTYCPKCKTTNDAIFEVKTNQYPTELGHRVADDDEDLDDLASKLIEQNSKKPLVQGKKEVDYDSKTSKLPQYLLMGYTMLNDYCEGNVMMVMMQTAWFL